MKRRTAGEGTIYQSSNGRWVAMIELPRHPDGRRNRKMRRARTQTEAKRKLVDLRKEFETNGSIFPRNRMVSTTVSDYLDVRLALGRSKSTLSRDRRFHGITSAYFSARQTPELTVQDCDQFLLDLAQANTRYVESCLSRDEIRRVRAFLSSALNNDIRLGLLNKNVAEVAVLPPSISTKKKRRALTNAEWLTLFEAAQGTTKLIVDLGGRHGLRPQEIRSIRWSEIDLSIGTLSVTVQFDSDNHFTDPKTLRSTRTIRLHSETADLLDQRRNLQHKDRIKYSDIWVDRDLIITTRRGTAINKDNQRRSLRTLCERTGIASITPYELRHTAITHQIAAGRTASEVADWAGTSEKMIFNHYRHQLREIIELPPVEHGLGGKEKVDHRK